MARQSNILIDGAAFAANRDLGMLNPAMGGMFGYASNPTEWLSAQGYVPRHLIPIALEAPGFFQAMPSPEHWVQAFKVLFEKHARTIEGLKAGLNVETAEHQFGGGGEFFTEFTDVKRERSNLSIGLVEKAGNVWQTFLEQWILNGMMHPETKMPLLLTNGNAAPKDWLADWYGGSVAFIEPTYDGRRAAKCWLSVNIWPTSTGPIEGKMDKTSALSLRELSIDMASLNFYNEGTRDLGQHLLDALGYSGANPLYMKAAISEIAPDVAKAAKGYAESVQTIADNQVTP